MDVLLEKVEMRTFTALFNSHFEHILFRPEKEALYIQLVNKQKSILIEHRIDKRLLKKYRPHGEYLAIPYTSLAVRGMDSLRIRSEGAFLKFFWSGDGLCFEKSIYTVDLECIRIVFRPERSVRMDPGPFLSFLRLVNGPLEIFAENERLLLVTKPEEEQLVSTYTISVDPGSSFSAVLTKACASKIPKPNFYSTLSLSASADNLLRITMESAGIRTKTTISASVLFFTCMPKYTA